MPGAAVWRSVCGLAFALTACARWAPAPPAAPPREPERAVVFVPHASGAFGPEAARLSVAVRMATPADLGGIEPPERPLREALELTGGIVLQSGSGFVLAAQGCVPCLSVAVLAAGLGVVLVPAVLALDAVQHAQAERVAAAVVRADLPAQTQAALRRLHPTDSSAASAELVVLGYGFAEAAPHGACFFLDARLRAAGLEDLILLGPWRRSNDAPAPHCAERATLAADGGALTARFVAESAEILAAIATLRLGAAP